LRAGALLRALARPNAQRWREKVDNPEEKCHANHTLQVVIGACAASPAASTGKRETMTLPDLQRELYDRIRTDAQLFDFLQSASMDGLWYWDLERRDRAWMNADFWRLFGVDPDEVPDDPGSAWFERVHPEECDAVMTQFERHLADPEEPYDVIVISCTGARL
jgi:PAS domain-containing protein